MDRLSARLVGLNDTVRASTALGALTRPGLVISLIGNLGAGKTTFVRGFAQGLGVSADQLVTSPTFMLIQEYEGRLPIYHFDTYRLDRPADLMALGAEEYFFGDGVCLVEWGDRVATMLPSERLDVVLAMPTEMNAEPTDRLLEARSIGTTWNRLLEDWGRRLEAMGISTYF